IYNRQVDIYGKKSAKLFYELMAMKKHHHILLVCVLLYVFLPCIAKATNGLNLLDSGGISAAMAGADTALALDFSTINSNPAGMSRLPGTHLGLSLIVLQGSISLRNSLNDRDGENQPVVIPHMGLVHHLSGTPFTLGLGLFTMGGYIAEFEHLNIPRFGPDGVFGGTVDKQSAHLRHGKLTPTIAYEVTKDLSFGVGLSISYADISLKILPHTPSMPGLAFGFETKGNCDRAYGLAFPPASCNYDVSFAPKFGAMYRLNDM